MCRNILWGIAVEVKKSSKINIRTNGNNVNANTGNQKKIRCV